MVDSCFNCSACKAGEEQKCTKQVGTYNAPSTPRSESYPTGGRTLGGYTNLMVVHEQFAIIIPDDYPLACAGPVMCSGVTLYDPLVRYGATKGSNVAIIGIGGLGIIGMKIAKAMGCKVTAISRSPVSSEKGQTAVLKCKIDSYIQSTDSKQMTSHAGSYDIILNTIPNEHDYTIYNPLLAKNGKHIILGLNTGLVAGIIVDAITCGSSKVKGSVIGSIKATQEVINLCNKERYLCV